MLRQPYFELLKVLVKSMVCSLKHDLLDFALARKACRRHIVQYAKVRAWSCLGGGSVLFRLGPRDSGCGYDGRQNSPGPLGHELQEEVVGILWPPAEEQEEEAGILISDSKASIFPAGVLCPSGPCCSVYL